MTNEERKLRNYLIMNNLDSLPLKGAGLWVLKNDIGHIIDTRIVLPNTITVGGDYICANANADRGAAQINWMGVGETSGGKSTASNALEAQVNPRVVCDSRTNPAPPDADDNNVIWVCTFAAGVCTGALVEAGLFNDLTAGYMVAYQEFSVINKAAADSLVGTWTITYGAS